jgi:hypothetical protein
MPGLGAWDARTTRTELFEKSDWGRWGYSAAQLICPLRRALGFQALQPSQQEADVLRQFLPYDISSRFAQGRAEPPDKIDVVDLGDVLGLSVHGSFDAR